MSQRCGTLSTGQAQRVSVARALVHDPPALILDEPTMGLDVLSGQVIYRFIEAERDRGKAIVFSTHQMAEVELLADRVGVLSGGRLVAEGTPASLIERTGEAQLGTRVPRAGQGRRRERNGGHAPRGAGMSIAWVVFQ